MYCKLTDEEEDMSTKMDDQQLVDSLFISCDPFLGEFRVECRHWNNVLFLSLIVCAEIKPEAMCPIIEISYKDIPALRAALDAAERFRITSAVSDYRAQHPKHGRTKIAAALVDNFETMDTRPGGRARAISRLAKRIERAERWAKRSSGLKP